MIKWVQSILKAVKRLMKKVVGLFGGSGGPAAAIEDMIEALPDDTAVADITDEVAHEEKLADWAHGMSPAHQVRMYALEPEESRHTRVLDLLSTEQRGWLGNLNEDELANVAKATDSQIADAFKGLPCAIGAVQSVGVKTPDLVAPTLATRIATYRSVSRELQHVL